MVDAFSMSINYLNEKYKNSSLGLGVSSSTKTIVRGKCIDMKAIQADANQFLADVQAPILRHYPRYLEAVSLRLQRLTQDPQKDAKRQAQIQPWWQRYLDYLEAAGDYTNDLDYYRWLLEEYRVSLFAQDLGTRQKVSEKRLEEAWESVDSI